MADGPLGLAGPVRMLQVVLAQQVLAVVVAVRCAHHRVNVLVVRRVGILRVLLQVGRHLMIELDQDARAVHAVG